jgi:hypothetical protein
VTGPKLIAQLEHLFSDCAPNAIYSHQDRALVGAAILRLCFDAAVDVVNLCHLFVQQNSVLVLDFIKKNLQKPLAIKEENRIPVSS